MGATKTTAAGTRELERAVAELQEQVKDLAEKVIGVKWDSRLGRFNYAEALRESREAVKR